MKMYLVIIADRELVKALRKGDARLLNDLGVARQIGAKIHVTYTGLKKSDVKYLLKKLAELGFSEMVDLPFGEKKSLGQMGYII